MASLLKGILPKDHVISQYMERLAEKNLSSRTKAERRAAEKLIQVSQFQPPLPCQTLPVSWLESGTTNEKCSIGGQQFIPSVHGEGSSICLSTRTIHLCRTKRQLICRQLNCSDFRPSVYIMQPTPTMCIWGRFSLQRYQCLSCIQAEIAESLVEFEMPDRSEQAAIKLREIQDSVPIPERVWALRNVGSTSAMGGPEGRSRARKLLDQAIALKLELVGSIKHPGMNIIHLYCSLVTSSLHIVHLY